MKLHPRAFSRLQFAMWTSFLGAILSLAVLGRDAFAWTLPLFAMSLGLYLWVPTLTVEPIAELSATPQYVVVLVHGTWATGAAWLKEASALRRELSQQVEAEVLWVPFLWTGRNTHRARMRAATQLASLLCGLRARFATEKLLVIGHSHGGNVALYASRLLPPACTIEGVVCLSTPFFHAQPRTLGPFGKQGVIFTVGAIAALSIAGLALDGISLLTTSDNRYWAGLFTFVVALVVYTNYAGKHFDRWLIRSRAKIDEVTLSSVAHPLLCIRMSGDEATAVLGLAQLATRLTHILWTTTNTFTSAFLFVIAALTESCGCLGLMLIILLTASKVALVLSVNVALTLVGIVVANVAIMHLAGPGLGIYSVLIEVSVEPTPLGTWEVTTLAARERWPKGTQLIEVADVIAPEAKALLEGQAGPWFSHSRAYGDPRVMERISGWMLRL
jgi:pimeloyl-ACP methyl ester carboxylesterase